LKPHLSFTSRSYSHEISRNLHFDGVDPENSERIRRLADQNPKDGMKQYMLIRDLIKQKDWNAIYARVNNPEYAIDPRAYAEIDSAMDSSTASRFHMSTRPPLDGDHHAGAGAGVTGAHSSPYPPPPYYYPPPNPFPLNSNTTLKVDIQSVPSYYRISSLISLGSYIVIGGAILYISYKSLLKPDSKGSSNLFGMKNSVHKEATFVDVAFKDVLGCDEAKEQLEDIVAYLKRPDMFAALGASLPKGVLLVGAPGTGKTLLARAIAGEANVPFFYTNGSEFDEVFVGVGPKRVRELFEDAKKHAPCIVFIDEIDSIGQRRLSPHNNKNETLNQLLSELDGFQKNSGIILIGATNLPDVLDSALKRSGRFDKIVNVPVPDIRGRFDILCHYLKKVKCSPDVSEEFILKLARTTIGMTGADLSNLVNQAAVKAGVGNLKAITSKHLEEAYDDMIMGVARKSAVISDEEKRLTAYHEGGHAIVAWYTQDSGSHPIRKATILPRGNALGFVAQLPDKDQTSFSRKQMLSQIAVAMAGRLAEELIFGPEELTSGASSDLRNASRLANEMVMRWGMSEKVGPIYIEHKQNRNNDVSGKTLEKIDEEVAKILLEQQNRAKSILSEHRHQLHLLANALIEHETLNYEEIGIILNGGRLKR